MEQPEPEEPEPEEAEQEPDEENQEGVLVDESSEGEHDKSYESPEDPHVEPVDDDQGTGQKEMDDYADGEGETEGEESEMEPDQIPLLFVDVNLGEGMSVRIVLYDGDKPEELARDFA